MICGILSGTVIAIGAVLIIMLVVDSWHLDETENGND